MAVPRKAISQRNSTGHCSGLIFEGFQHGSPGRIFSLRPSQSCLKASKIGPRPQNAIDIALRRMAIPAGSLARISEEWKSMARTSRFFQVFFAILCLWLSVFPGCAGLGRTLEPPRIRLAHVDVKEIKAFESVFEIQLRVFNTNDVAIEVKGIDCDVTVNEKKFATGVAKIEREIPAFGTNTFPITVYSSLVDLVRGAVGLRQEEKLKFKVAGHVRLGGGLFVPSMVPFKTAATLSIEGLSEPR
jgi:LEA14-like dessication related protein